MKEAYLTRHAGPEHLRFGDSPQPRPLRAEVLVQVRASAITPTEFNSPFEKVACNIDVVFDAVGGETLDRSSSLLRPGGRLVTIAAQSEALKDPRVRDAFFIVEPNQGQLAEIARLFDSGKVRAFVETVFGLNQVREAYARAKRGGMRGKVALQVKNGS